MTRELLDALINYINVKAVEAVYQVNDPEWARPQDTKAAIERVYAAFYKMPTE